MRRLGLVRDSIRSLDNSWISIKFSLGMCIAERSLTFPRSGELSRTRHKSDNDNGGLSLKRGTNFSCVIQEVQETSLLSDALCFCAHFAPENIADTSPIHRRYNGDASILDIVRYFNNNLHLIDECGVTKVQNASRDPCSIVASQGRISQGKRGQKVRGQLCLHSSGVNRSH